VGEDAELRQLWAKYLVTLDAHNKAHAAHSELRRRSAVDAEFDALRDNYSQRRHGLGRLHGILWKKHGLEPSCAAWEREGRNLSRIVKAIRKAKAESLFGIGVKLSVVEDPNGVTLDDMAASIDDARRSIAAALGVDFIAATGPIGEV
jgi:hypothetical protein